MHYIICTEIKISNIIPPLCGVHKTQWTEHERTRFELLSIRITFEYLILHRLLISLSDHVPLLFFLFASDRFAYQRTIFKIDIYFILFFFRHRVYRACHLVQHNNAEWRFTLYTQLHGVLCNIMYPYVNFLIQHVCCKNRMITYAYNNVCSFKRQTRKQIILKCFFLRVYKFIYLYYNNRL